MVEVVAAINIFSDTSMGALEPSYCKSPTSSVKPMGEYFSSNLSPWRVPMVTISNINIKRAWKYVEPTLAVNMWRGCLICMGYIYFDHRISRDPSLKRICIFVKKYTFLLGKKCEKVENIWNHIGQQRRYHVYNSFLHFWAIPFQDTDQKSTIALFLRQGCAIILCSLDIEK